MNGALLDDGNFGIAKVPRPFIAIAGLGCENLTFTTSRTKAAAFHPRRGDEMIQNMCFPNHDRSSGKLLTGEEDCLATLCLEVLLLTKPSSH